MMSGPVLEPRSGLRSVGFASLVALSACADLVDLPEPSDPPPVIEGLLVAGAGSAWFRIVEAARWNDPDPPAPVAPAVVALRLASPNGEAAALGPVPDSTGWFRAVLPIVAGARYRLEGAIGGAPVQAETVIPGPFEVELPAGDTVELALGRIQVLPFRWRAAGASLFATPDGLFALARPYTRDTTGELAVAPPPRPADVPLTVWALDPNAADWLLDRPAPRGNVHGAIGLLGGAAVIRRTLRWR